MWVEVFKTGVHTNSAGETRTWGKDDLDKIVSQYNPKQHEAPIVIGHPKDNAPAYGWVEALKREGETLYAKLKDLAPEFLDIVKKGLFKKQSISLYPDLFLKHIGFLGAMAPAIKGLADIKFREGGRVMTYEFSIENDSDPGEALHHKILEFMEAPPKRDRKGRELPQNISYGEAFEIVCEENPDLALQYAESIWGGKK